MKKLILFASLSVLPALSFAQGFQIGIKGGVNLSKLSFGNFVDASTNANGSPNVGFDGETFRNSISDSFNSKMGTSFGVYARFGKNLFVQPELLYSTRAGDFSYTQNNQTVTSTVRLTTFDVPVLLGIKGGPLRVVAGPVASFRINDNQTLGQAIQQYSNGSLNSAWSQAFYGYQVGGGLDIGSLGLDVRYQGNLTDIAQIKNNSGQFSQGLKSWQVTLALKLF